MKRIVSAVALTLALATTTAQAYTGNQIRPLTCAAVFATAADEYNRTGRAQDAAASGYLAGAFEQQVIQAAGPSGRRSAVRQLRSAADLERTTAQVNGGLKYLQPRIGACVGLADRLGI